MRVLIVNTSERTGGAAIAANRLMNALNHNGVEARMLVRDRQSGDPHVSTIPQSWLLKAKFLWERGVIWLANGLSKHNLFQVDIANVGTDITGMDEFKRADVVHLHWTNQGFLSLGDLQRILASGKPVVVTMHDQWYYTGICHHSAGCEKYKSRCEKCPMMNNGGIGVDLARRVYESKRDIYADKNISFVGCSHWITDLAQRSALTHGHLVTNIPNALDTSLFCPADQAAARIKLGLPADKRLLLFGARRITDEMKGFHLLVAVCDHLVNRYPDLASHVEVVVLGGDAASVKSSLPLPVHALNYMSSEAEIASIYNAVDLFVTPSLLENLPNTIAEAMACGTPCVGFNVGGIPEMIDHRINGYVARYRDSEDFADGIAWVLDATRHRSLQEQARSKAVASYGEAAVAARYIDVYRTALAQ